jgi:hypothetical protein
MDEKNPVIRFCGHILFLRLIFKARLSSNYQSQLVHDSQIKSAFILKTELSSTGIKCM